jgi:hypothetical protein
MLSSPIFKNMMHPVLTTALVIRKAAWHVMAVAEGDSIHF